MKRGDKRAIIIGTVIVLIASFSVLTYKLSAKAVNPVLPPTTTLRLANPPTVARLFELVNTERVKVGVAPLIIDERLNQSAQFKADNIVKRNYFSHFDPETSKKNGLDYLISISDNLCTNVSENIV